MAAAVAVVAGGCFDSSSTGRREARRPAGDGVAIGFVASQRGPILDAARSRGLVPASHAVVRITGRATSGTRVVRLATTDAHGDFRASLPPGRYAVAAPAVGRRTVRIAPGRGTGVWIVRYVTMLRAYAPVV